MLPVITGAFLVGLVLFYFRATDAFWSFVAAVGGCGIGHALIRAPMTALAVRLAAGSGPKLSALRFGERTGALAGLTAVAFLLSSSDTAETLATLGAVTLAGGAVFAIIFVFSGRDKGVGQ